MDKRRLLLTIIIIIVISLAFLIYLFHSDKITKLVNKNAAKIKIFQLLDEGYTYNLEWVPGQDKLLAYLDGYIELVDIYSRKRETILKLDKKEINGYQPLNISPDGSKVILKENESVIIFNLQTQTKEITLIEGTALAFSWSPDGKNIVYESSNDIFTYSLEKKQKKQLTFSQKYWYPHWARIGNYISFRDYRKNGLWVITSDGTNLKKLIDDEVYAYQWHPFKNEIIFSRKGKDEYSLYIVSVDSGKTNIYYKLDFPTERSISPDGKFIALTRETISHDAIDNISFDQDVKDVDIILVDISSCYSSNITQTPNIMEISPNWSPDGKKILAFRVSNYSDRKPIPIIIEVNS